MKMPDKIENNMIAPCGVNCIACSAYLNTNNPCPGCRASSEEHKRNSCKNCVKKRCAFEKGFTWCFECNKFPCSRIKDLSKRYMQNYDIDLVQNGVEAKSDMSLFMKAQRECYICHLCGGVIDQHHKKCSECGNKTIIRMSKNEK